MQINLNTNNTSFGMAKLTKVGRRLAENTLGEIQELSDGRIYQKSHMLPSLLKKINNGSANLEELSDFFENGRTKYEYNNAKFFKKQISGFTDLNAIKKFLKKSCVSKAQDECTLNIKGNQLVNEILDTIDFNIANTKISAEEQARVLDVLSDFTPEDKLVPRFAILNCFKYKK